MNRCKETQVYTDLQMHISKSFFLIRKGYPLSYQTQWILSHSFLCLHCSLEHFYCNKNLWILLKVYWWMIYCIILKYLFLLWSLLLKLFHYITCIFLFISCFPSHRHCRHLNVYWRPDLCYVCKLGQNYTYNWKAQLLLLT